MLTNEQDRAVKKIVKEEGFRDFSISVEEGSKKGDNYLGNIFLITVSETGGSKEKFFILKCALDNEQVRAQMPINECYKREVYLYHTVLPAFKKLQEDYPVCRPFKAFAKMYECSLDEGKEWLLFENITTRGFKMCNRKVTMNGDHISMVLNELGKLHSLSFVMEQLKPDQYQEYRSNLKDYFKDHPNIMKSWSEGIKNKFEIAYKAVEGHAEATEGLKKCEKSLSSLLEELDDENNKAVIVHGDAWCNNMMFKYDDKNHPIQPTELCFLDWQISKVTTPITDLCYFLFLSASKEVLDNHKIYLRQYYRVLDDNLRSVGLEVQSLYPYRVFEDQWKKYCKLGLYIAIGIIDKLLLDEKDAKTFSDMAEDGGDFLKAFSQSSVQNENSYSRIRDIVVMMAENKYL